MDPCLPQPPSTLLPSGQAEPWEFSSKLQPVELSTRKPQRQGQSRVRQKGPSF